MIDFSIDTNELTSGLNTAITDQMKKVNFNAIYRGIGEVLQTAMRDQFESEGAYFGKSWASLAPSTIESRRKKGNWPGAILQVSAAGLKNSFTHSLVGNTLVFGTNKSYAKYLHFGTKNMPARPLFTSLLNEEVKEEIRDVIYLSLQ
jgi:phage gpG-like protein